jgi:hypothetical protein
MKKEYKEVYNLVNSLNLSCDYIKFKYGIYSLNVYSMDFNALGNGLKYYVCAFSLEDLKNNILNIVKKENIKE